MTSPIQEPSTDRTLSGLGWATRQLARRPAPVSGASQMSWMAVYDDSYLGFPYSTASGQVAMQFPYIDWSDNALSADGGPFSYTTESGSAFGKTYAYILQIETEGIYAITVSCASEDLNATKDYKFRVGVNVGGDYPGRKSADADLWSEDNVLNQDFSTGYLRYERTWVLPIKILGSPPEQIVPLIRIQLASAEVGDKSWTLRNRMWVTYLSDDFYAAASFIDSNDPGPP